MGDQIAEDLVGHFGGFHTYSWELQRQGIGLWGSCRQVRETTFRNLVGGL